jgi:hypothetical protein
MKAYRGIEAMTWGDNRIAAALAMGVFFFAGAACARPMAAPHQHIGYQHPAPPSARDAIDQSMARIAVRSTYAKTAAKPLSQHDLLDLLVLFSLRPASRIHTT